MKSYVPDFVREAERLGVVDIRLEPGPKTIKFTGKASGSRILYFLAISPSDSRRGLKNAIAVLRRLVRRATGAPNKARSQTPSKTRAKHSPRPASPKLAPTQANTQRGHPDRVVRQSFPAAAPAPPSSTGVWEALRPLLHSLQTTQSADDERTPIAGNKP